MEERNSEACGQLQNLENMVNVRDGIVFAIAPGFEVNEKDTKIL